MKILLVIKNDHKKNSDFLAQLPLKSVYAMKNYEYLYDYNKSKR